MNHRRGALLLEIILALAIFVMAGGAILALLNQTMGDVQRTRLAGRAADLARSTMAKLEAGLGTAESLSGPVKAWPEGDDGRPTDAAAGEGPVDLSEVHLDNAGIAAAPSGWEVQIETDQSQFPGLTRVTVRAFKRAGQGDKTEAEYTLRQLVRLSGKGEDRAGAADSLAEEAKKGLAADRLGQPRSGGAATPAGGKP